MVSGVSMSLECRGSRRVLWSRERFWIFSVFGVLGFVAAMRVFNSSILEIELRTCSWRGKVFELSGTGLTSWR